MPEPQHFNCLHLKERIEALERDRARLDALERSHARMAEAYIKSDLGTPDYDGHRRDHFIRKKQNEVVDSYKHKYTAEIVWAVLVGIGGIAAFGLLEWLKTHLK
jgi:hypothetical protein